MSLYNIPLLNGYKSAIAGWGLVLVGVGGLLTALGTCLQSLELSTCYAEIGASYEALLAALAGVGVLGIAHKFEKGK